MSRQILFVQGGREGTYDEWDSKLVASLEREVGEGFAVVYPRMPDEGDPRYAAWKSVLLNELEALDEGAILVGHSFGGAILIHVLAEVRPKRKLGAIALIAAPFIGEGGWQVGEITPRADVADRLPADVPVFLYHGTADDDVSFEHLQLYAKAIPQATIRALERRDHQLNNDLSDVARDIRNVL